MVEVWCLWLCRTLQCTSLFCLYAYAYAYGYATSENQALEVLMHIVQVLLINYSGCSIGAQPYALMLNLMPANANSLERTRIPS